MLDPLAVQHAGPQQRAVTGSRTETVDGWQIVAVKGVDTARRGLQREFEIANQVGAAIRKPTILIWRSQRALIVARSETRSPRFAAASARLAEMGWPVSVRRFGGGAFPIGPGTVQIAVTARYPGLGNSIEAIYERLGLLIASTLAAFGMAARVGETPSSFCNGRHDFIVADRKIAGLAQHWRLCGDGERCVTAVASVLVDTEVGELARIVDHFYAMCGQTIDIRAEAMTTVRLNCDADAPSQRDLTAEFLTHLAAAAARMGLSANSSRPTMPTADGIRCISP